MPNTYRSEYDTTDWRFGFEVEMLFGDLGLDRYKDLWDGPFDRASTRYCRDIAARLSEVTGVKWRGRDESPAKTGFYVVPEYDLDPISFPDNAVGGVELITPPLKMKDAEELRSIISSAVLQIEGGFVDPVSEDGQGWHVNVDRGSRNDHFNPAQAVGAMWEGDNTELDILLSNGRYKTSYASPQHHAYGPALIDAMRSPMFPMDACNLDNFLFRHLGKSKKYATNFDKLNRGYLELRHYGLSEFLGPLSIETLYGSIFKSLSIAPRNSAPFTDRLFERFVLLAEFTDNIGPLLSFQTRSTSDISLASWGRLLYKDELMANVSWEGFAEVFLAEADNPNQNRRFQLTTGIVAHEIVPSISLLALDAIYDGVRCDREFTSSSNAFNDAILALSEQYQSAELFPSEGLLDKMLVKPKGKTLT